MTLETKLRPGIETLLSKHRKWLKKKRFGLVSHVAAIDSEGRLSAERLWDDDAVNLTGIFGPEHGFFGTAGAGERCRTSVHPSWSIPIHSLYGRTRKPTPEMLHDVDTLIFDVQDIGARPYTYVSTLRYVLEAASALDREVIVADRPIPLPRTTDGPTTEKSCASFVSAVDTPLAYGMTPGETALWLRDTLGLTLDLKIAKMQGYRRQPRREKGWPAWVPPSPGIVSWAAAACFPATVCFEGLPAIDHGRGTRLPFQLIGSCWMNGRQAAQFLRDLKLPGVGFRAARYTGKNSQQLDGVRITVTDPDRFKPVLTAVSIIHCLQELYGKHRVWNGARPGFFDRLFGTGTVRKALMRGDDGKTIAAGWRSDLEAFRRTRQACLLYR